jgi:hypothetical protein
MHSLTVTDSAGDVVYHQITYTMDLQDQLTEQGNN